MDPLQWSSSPAARIDSTIKKFLEDGLNHIHDSRHEDGTWDVVRGLWRSMLREPRRARGQAPRGTENIERAFCLQSKTVNGGETCDWASEKPNGAFLTITVLCVRHESRFRLACERIYGKETNLSWWSEYQNHE